MRKVLFLLLLSRFASAQLYEAKSCVYREGDDVAWAQPDYDDSGWSRPSPISNDVRQPGPSIWLRCRIVAEPFDPRILNSGTPLFVQDGHEGAREVFVNGIEVGSFGNVATGRFDLAFDRYWPIPATARARAFVVAVRMGVRAPTDLTLLPAIGSRELIESRSSHLRELLFLQAPFLAITAPAFLVLGLVLIVMSWGESRRDALFLGIMLMGAGIWVAGTILRMIDAPLPGTLSLTLRETGTMGIDFGVFFFYALQGRRIPVFYRSCFAFVILIDSYLLLVLPGLRDFAFESYAFLFTGTPLVVRNIFQILLFTSWVAAFLPLRSLRRGDVPFFLLAVIFFASQTAVRTAQMPWIGLPGAVNTLRSLRTAVQFFVSLGFVILLAGRMRRTAQREAVLQRDMDAAREMQRRLVPEAHPIPGFRIETAYLPAREVGGDFYQLLPGDDGSLLVVVGDVSGKGLDAAMLVSAVVGALGDLGSRVPADVLAHLNRALTGKTHGGFVTCCCALSHAGGTVEIANAGHIPPYMRGRELELAPGPPLGIIADAEYESTTVLPGAGAITFLSDGVVEATNARGELLGFDRLAGLSVKPAKEIAQEAERWGQEDDITVVQVAYA